MHHENVDWNFIYRYKSIASPLSLVRINYVFLNVPFFFPFLEYELAQHHVYKLVNMIRYWNTLATLTLIVLFVKMLKFSKKFKEKNRERKIKNLLEY
jgi:hypothetical protein